MKCPHCLVTIHADPQWLQLGKDKDGSWAVIKRDCPACGRMILILARGRPVYTQSPVGGQRFSHLQPVEDAALFHPRGAGRPPCPPEVPADAPDIAADYQEACLVLGDSAKASAALSRRCLQQLLRQKALVTPGNLNDEIEQVIQSGRLPSHISESLDAVRVIGNFAAHPIKSTSTGEIVAVEPGEAEWNLDVLESLFDFYFVQPAATAKRKAALNTKLKDAGKPPLKS